MALFKNLTNDGLEKSEDRLGGGFAAKESDIYHGKIKFAYATKSSGGAMGIVLSVALADNTEYRETLWITNKKGENFFLNKQDPTKKVPLPGFTVVDDICLVACEKPLSDMDSEEKTINVYDFEAKRELPKSVDMLVELIGKDVALAIVKETVNKQAKNEATGEYEPTNETREQNVITKVFEPNSKFTVAEAREGADAPAFYDAWLERNKGKTIDRTAKTGSASGAPGQAPAANASAGAAPKKSLFGKKS